MDLDLEADLGIDTVKQAEVFADDPRGVWDRARRLAEAARLPDAQPRRRRSSASATGTATTVAPHGRAGDVRRAAPSSGRHRRRRSAGFPRRVPVAGAAPAAGALRRRPASTLGEGSRVLVMPDGGGVAAALTAELEKPASRSLTIDGRAAPRRSRRSSRVADGRADPRRLLAAGPRRRGPAAELDRRRHEALRVRVKLLAVTHACARRRASPFLVSRHAARRPPRLRRGGRDLRARRRGHRLHQGARARAPRRARQGGRLRDRPQDAALADR